MGTYKGIQGYRVESLASDPGDITKVIGKVWYNSSSNVWKVGVEAPGSWSAAPTLNFPVVELYQSCPTAFAAGRSLDNFWTVNP